jgi:hypothetical protein
MKPHRLIAPAASALLASMATAAPMTADASPLLSGYGGPGAGSQVLLGSTLIGGGRGGGSGGSGTSNLALPATASSQTTGSHHGTGGATRRSTRHTAASAPPGARMPAPVSAFVRTSRAADSSTVLGLTGVDALLIALTIAALAVIAFVLHRLARTPGPPKGLSGSPRRGS